MITAIFMILIGFIFLMKGADVLVDGSSSIAKHFHIPEIIIGLTIVSIGTSMPELFVSITSALEGFSDVSLGNVIGSNLCNMLLILGISTILKSVKFQKETKKYEIPMCLIFTIVFTILCNTNNKISRIESIILLVLFVLFITYTIITGIKASKKEEQEEIEESKEEVEIKKQEETKRSVLKSIVLIIIGIVALKFGGDFVVDNALFIARKFNVSEKIISLTLLAIGTSLPELVTSVTAALKGNSDIAIGNIIGSNIFNILLIIGVSSMIKPITFNASYNFDLIFLVISTIILAIFPYIPPKDEMSRTNGVIYFILYIVYITTLFFI